MKNNHSEPDFIKGIKENDNKIIEQLRKEIFPLIRNYILSNSGTLEDAKDIFNDAFLEVFKKIKNDDLILTTRFSNYFMTVCNNKWKKKLRKRKNMPTTDDFETVQLIYKPYDSTKDKLSQLFYSELGKLDTRSQELIQLTLDGKKNQEIAKIMDFKTTQAVADKKNSVLNNLKNRLLKVNSIKSLKKRT